MLASRGGTRFAPTGFLVAWIGLHFLLIITVSCRDIVWLVAHKLTILPAPFTVAAQRVEAITSSALGNNARTSNPFRRALLTYLHIAGIDNGYGYFAPNVPAGYKLIFELHFADGRVEYKLPRVSNAAAGLRVATLLDEIGRTKSEPLRQYMIKMLATSAWSEHPDVISIRAVFGSLNLPSPEEFASGQLESYDFLYAYDFSRAEESVESANP
jgi:hypothetical protein